MFMGKLFVVVIALLGLIGALGGQPPKPKRLILNWHARAQRIFETSTLICIPARWLHKTWCSNHWSSIQRASNPGSRKLGNLPDGRATFHLRKDVLHPDGTPFNAEAVKANMDAIVSNLPRHSNGYGQRNRPPVRPLTNIPTGWCQASLPPLSQSWG